MADTFEMHDGGYEEDPQNPEDPNQEISQLATEYSAKCMRYVFEQAEEGITFAEMEEKKKLPKDDPRHPADKRIGRYSVFNQAVEDMKELEIKNLSIGVTGYVKTMSDKAVEASHSPKMPALEESFGKERNAFRKKEDEVAKLLGLPVNKVEELLDIYQYASKEKRKENREKEFSRLCQYYKIQNASQEEIARLFEQKRAVYKKYADAFSKLADEVQGE